MKKLTILIAALTLVACQKDDELPTPQEKQVSNTTVIADTVSTKIVKLDVENHHSISESSHSSNGTLLASYDHGQWYEYELKEGEYLTVSSSSIINNGSPVINVYVNGVLTHTEGGNNYGLVSYTYTNN